MPAPEARHLGILRVTVILAAAALSGCGFVSGSASSATSGPSSASSPTGRALPSMSASPTASPASTVVAFPLLSNRAIARVTVDALNLRVSASQSATKIETLAAGTRLFVIGAPQEAGELRWYRVAVADRNTCVFCPIGIGWVATPATGVETWLAEVEVDCPPSPTTIDELAVLTPLERLHCYGNQKLTLTGWVDSPCCSTMSPYTFSPEWLAFPDGAGFFRTTDNGSYVTQFHFVPGAGLILPKTTNIIRFTGHFEDPAAPTCRASADHPESYGSVAPLDPAWVVLSCRTNLVVTGYEVIGYKAPLGGCGCLPPSPSPGMGMAPQAHELG